MASTEKATDTRGGIRSSPSRDFPTSLMWSPFYSLCHVHSPFCLSSSKGRKTKRFCRCLRHRAIDDVTTRVAMSGIHPGRKLNLGGAQGLKHQRTRLSTNVSWPCSGVEYLEKFKRLTRALRWDVTSIGAPAQHIECIQQTSESCFIPLVSRLHLMTSICAT